MQLQALTNDATSTKLYGLAVYEDRLRVRADNRFLVGGYRANAETIVGKDENLFKIEYVCLGVGGPKLRWGQ